jgi:hypothetical protein
VGTPAFFMIRDIEALLRRVVEQGEEFAFPEIHAAILHAAGVGVSSPDIPGCPGRWGKNVREAARAARRSTGAVHILGGKPIIA